MQKQLKFVLVIFSDLLKPIHIPNFVINAKDIFLGKLIIGIQN